MKRTKRDYRKNAPVSRRAGPPMTNRQTQKRNLASPAPFPRGR